MDVLEHLAKVVSARKPSGRPFVVGINGVEGSGKSTLSLKLSTLLEEYGHDVHVISVDDFHRPREVRFRRGELSPEGYRFDSVDLPALTERVLIPLRTAQSFPVEVAIALWDVLNDRPLVRLASVAANAIVLVEGVFLFEEPALAHLDLKVFVKAEFEVILDRVMARDRSRFGSANDVIARYRTKYIPGQMLYLDQVRPEVLADIVVDNNDPTTAQLLKNRSAASAKPPES
jgi:uridine kinase